MWPALLFVLPVDFCMLLLLLIVRLAAGSMLQSVYYMYVYVYVCLCALFRWVWAILSRSVSFSPLLSECVCLCRCYAHLCTSLFTQSPALYRSLTPSLDLLINFYLYILFGSMWRLLCVALFIVWIYLLLMRCVLKFCNFFFSSSFSIYNVLTHGLSVCCLCVAFLSP